MTFTALVPVAEKPGWRECDGLFTDSFQSIRCDHRIGRRKCKNTARFHNGDSGRVLCLVHFRMENP